MKYFFELVSNAIVPASVILKEGSVLNFDRVVFVAFCVLHCADIISGCLSLHDYPMYSSFFMFFSLISVDFQKTFDLMTRPKLVCACHPLSPDPVSLPREHAGG